eukprot:gene5702-6404_t
MSGRPSKPASASSRAHSDIVGQRSGVTSRSKTVHGQTRISKVPKKDTNDRPSSKLNPKTVNPFEDKAPKSTFETAYVNGAVPCRLIHGSVKHKLQWKTPPENLNFDPILVTLAEGLREKRHPYTFVACEGFKDMLTVEDAEQRTIPLLPKLVPPLRLALGASDNEVFYRALQALVQLSDVTGPAMNVHLKLVLPQVSKRMLDRNHKEKVISALQRIEYNGGKESVSIIKARIPTYSSIY